MQLTRFDRWLRKRFVHEIHISTMRPPLHVPPNARHTELPETSPGRYKHHFIFTNEEEANDLLAALKDTGQMFTTRVVDRSKWYVPLIAPANNSSFTWWVVGQLVTATFVFFLAGLLIRTLLDPEMMQEISDALKTFKQ